MSKSRIVCVIALNVRWCVLQLSKLRLLEFYYDFLDYYCVSSNWPFQECDKNYLYISNHGNHNSRSIVRPYMLVVFDSSMNCHCDDDEPYSSARFLLTVLVLRNFIISTIKKHPSFSKFNALEQRWLFCRPRHIRSKRSTAL